MAESADILTAAHQQVILPNLAAGCSMADMAYIDEVQDCWDDPREPGPRPRDHPGHLHELRRRPEGLRGKHGGVVCTSSNARAVLAWALERGKRILFFPDQHLGRNTALAMGYTLEDTAVWARATSGGPGARLQSATFLLWKGHCSVHGRFRPEQVAAREQHPGGGWWCTRSAPGRWCDLADKVGSTEYIIGWYEAACRER